MNLDTGIVIKNGLIHGEDYFRIIVANGLKRAQFALSYFFIHDCSRKKSDSRFFHLLLLVMALFGMKGSGKTTTILEMEKGCEVSIK